MLDKIFDVDVHMDKASVVPRLSILCKVGVGDQAPLIVWAGGDLHCRPLQGLDGRAAECVMRDRRGRTKYDRAEMRIRRKEQRRTDKS